ncbi:MAG: CapA family protein [Pseudomonadota bacterium]|nr:CapA family protein [Pseudomonadota bacterium]
MNSNSDTSRHNAVHPVTLFLCGDVMTGRGIDQVLPHPSAPALYEPYIRSAVDYVRIAERTNGRIPKPVSFDYVWGDVLEALREAAPDARIVNLETAVTRSDDYWPGKGINYRMHPHNLACLSAADIDCCALANNHVLDWGYAGLSETLASLRQAGIKTSGAGKDLAEAMSAATLDIGVQRRIIVLSFGSPSSGIPPAWSATDDRAGLWLLNDFSKQTVAGIARQTRSVKRGGDVLVASLHWGGNWGYHIPREQRRFAHALIDEAGVDVVHGHSSHHPKGIEVYRDRLILYGCGDFLNDYEGIRNHENFRGDLTLMYLPKLDPRDGRLLSLRMRPMQIRRFRLHYASQRDTQWLAYVLDREGKKLGTSIDVEDGSLRLRWS